MLREQIRYLRKNRGLTLQNMADALGITMRQYQNYEGGQAKPTIDGLVKIADFFNVSADYLLGREYYSNTPATSVDLCQENPPSCPRRQQSQ